MDNTKKYKCGFDGTIVFANIKYHLGNCSSKKQKTANQISCHKCGNFISYKNIVEE